MNTTKQFWALLKFQQSANPFLVFMPLFFTIPLFTTYYLTFGDKNYHPSLSLLLSNQGFYMVGILAVMWLAPEMLRKGGSGAIWSGGTEFLLTRALDRRMVVRARLVFFYFLILIVPLAVAGISLAKPELTISEYDPVVQQKVLDSFPGSKAEPKEKNKSMAVISVPNGQILTASWRLWAFLAGAVIIQGLIHLVYPWKFRRIIIWTLYFGVIFLPFLQMPEKGKISPSEAWFFSYANYWPWFWVAGIAALVIAQIWSERRFAATEQS